jgi:hypothetical protein
LFLFLFQSDDGTKDTIYYQWVVFMLAINGIMFKIPHLLWRVCEGGIMKEFHRGKNARSNLMEDDSMRSNIKIHMNSFKKLKGQKNLGYYTRFQICQVLNLLILILNWWATDSFLSGHFHTYGAEVTEFYSKDSYVRGVTHDPMCNAFPTVVSKILVRLTMRTNLPKLLDLLVFCVYNSLNFSLESFFVIS